jgi:transposase
MDLGDKNSRYCVLNETGEIVKEGRLATSKKGLALEFGALRRCRIALEVGRIPRG